MIKNGAPPTAAAITLKVIVFIFIIWAANLSYGFVHEAAHALVIKTLGGQVYELYVNPFGTDAHTTHSFVTGMAGVLSLELAGMAMTTALAFFTLLSDYAPLPLFVALRTAIYALNYSPGTDIYAIQQAVGSGSMPLSLLIVVINIACAAIAITALIKNVNIREPVLKRFLHL
jgi:hypothetical protein